MTKTVQIFEITYDNGKIRLLFPTILDIKCLLKENEDLFDMLLLGQLHIMPIHVVKNSKLYNVALQNRLVEIDS